MNSQSAIFGLESFDCAVIITDSTLDKFACLHLFQMCPVVAKPDAVT